MQEMDCWATGVAELSGEESMKGAEGLGEILNFLSCGFTTQYCNFLQYCVVNLTSSRFDHQPQVL